MADDLIARLRGPRTEQGGLWPIPNLHEEAADALEAMEAHIQRNEQHIHDLRLNVVALEAALEEQHRHYLKLELEKRAVEDIAEQFSKDKAEYYRHILRLDAALKPFADQCETLEANPASFGMFGLSEARAARAAMEGEDD